MSRSIKVSSDPENESFNRILNSILKNSKFGAKMEFNSGFV